MKNVFNGTLTFHNINDAFEIHYEFNDTRFRFIYTPTEFESINIQFIEETITYDSEGEEIMIQSLLIEDDIQNIDIAFLLDYFDNSVRKCQERDNRS